MTWVDGTWTDPVPPSDAQVREVENALRVPFPADYLAVARTHPGARPVPSDILLPNGFGTSVLGLLHHSDDGPMVSHILSCHFLLRDALDKGVIPFAQDVAHDVFCFSYRTDYDHPPVVHWSVDFGPLPLAPSFTAFLELLHDAG